MSFTGEEDMHCEYCQKEITRFQRVERYSKGKLQVLCFDCDERFRPRKAGKLTTEGGGRIERKLFDNQASGDRAQRDPLKGAGSGGDGVSSPPPKLNMKIEK